MARLNYDRCGWCGEYLIRFPNKNGGDLDNVQQIKDGLHAECYEKRQKVTKDYETRENEGRTPSWLRS